jgi:glucose-1-phosphate thymidylyltransferase
MKLPRIGLVPAAGQALRLGPIPSSKEILPVAGTNRMEPSCSSLLRQFRAAGADRACIIIRPGKWDIPDALGNGNRYGITIAYSVIPSSRGVPYTLDAAYEWVKESEVLAGFPDILIKPENALATLAEKRGATDAEVMLGLFPSTHPEKVDMVACNEMGNVNTIIIKDANCSLRECWLLAAWGPLFTEFLHDWITRQGDTEHAEPYLGDVFRDALSTGLKINAHRFSCGEYLDIGTPDDLKKARGKPGKQEA